MEVGGRRSDDGGRKMEAATNCNVENLEAEAGVLIQICGAELGAVCSFWGKAEAFMTNYRVVADVC